jgi:thiol-disulfide isomerase/thioredoxin
MSPTGRPRPRPSGSGGSSSGGSSSGGSRRRRAAQEAARWRRWRIGGAIAVAVAAAGAVLGLHYANRPTGTAGAPTAAATSDRLAPDGTFTDLAGQTVNVASLRGRPTLLWFVSTWCSSCQAGTTVIAQNLAKLTADGVRVDEIELYDDLGQSGPSMAQFAHVLAGAQFGNPDWTFGVSSAGLTRAYDPQGDLDIYYLLDSKGQVTYVNSSPGSTMSQLLAAAGKLT